MHVLNMAVSDALAASWRAWLAPERQPFFLTDTEAERFGWPTVAREEVALTPEERDTNTVWAVSREASRVAWLCRDEWAGLPRHVMAELLRTQARRGRGNLPRRRDYRDLLPHLSAPRFLWTPDLLTDAVLGRVIADGQHPCERAQVPAAVWRGAAAALPRARDLAGTFPRGSAGNCFGAVMGAAGVEGAEERWVQREPFEAFLGERTRPGGQDDSPGTLLIWRGVGGEVQHSAVTLGGGWAFEKPSQTWWTPRQVRPLRALIRANRAPGQRLERRRLI